MENTNIETEENQKEVIAQEESLVEGNQEAQELTEEDGDKSFEKSEEVIEKPILKRFVGNFKKDRESDAKVISDHVHAINDSHIGDVPFEDVLVFLFSNKMEESDYEQIRKYSFNRKLEDARVKYNKENKAEFSMQDFLAITLKDYMQ